MAVVGVLLMHRNLQSAYIKGPASRPQMWSLIWADGDKSQKAMQPWHEDKIRLVDWKPVAGDITAEELKKELKKGQ